MKKYFKFATALLAAGIMTTGFVSCSEDNPTSDPVAEKLGAEEDAYLASVLAGFVDNTVNPTYSQMARNATDFYNKMKTLRDAVANGAATQQMVDEACQSWKLTRADYEKSEAFLLGAANDYNIDPHIDTWPLDLTALHGLLSSPNMLAKYTSGDDEENIKNAHDDLNQTLLGFHAVEFIIFRDGEPRKVASFNSQFDDYNVRADFTGIKPIDELKYGLTVAGDLMYSIYELEVCWSGGTAEHKKALEDLEWKTTMPSSEGTYGDNMKNAGRVGSTYTTVKNAVSAILVGDKGCAGICDEVGNTKMGKPYGLKSNDDNQESDPNYIESPFSHNSLTDFWDNIESINNVWRGGLNARTQYSFAAYFEKLNPELGKKVQDAINNAQAKIKLCPAPFVLYYQTPQVLEAIKACDELSKALGEANSYIEKRIK